MKRKEKAKFYKDRESLCEKSNLLSQALVQILSKQCSHPKRVVKQTVESFLDQNKSLVINTSLRDVQSLVSFVKPALENIEVASRANIAKEKLEASPRMNEKENEACPVLEIKDQHLAKKEINISNPWLLIENYKIKKNEALKEKEIETALVRKKNMAAALDEQVRLKREVTNREKAENDQYVKKQEEAVQKWKEEQISKAKEEKKLSEKLKGVRLAQIEEKQNMRRKMKNERTKQETKELEEVEKALKQEEQKRILAKEQEKKKWEAIKLENKQKLEEKKKAKLQEAQIDFKLMQDLKERLDRKERNRVEAFEARKKNLELNTKLLNEDSNFKKKKEEHKKFEQGLLEAARKREEMQVLDDIKRKKAMKEKQQEINRTNRAIVEERQQIDRQEKAENELFAKKCEEEVTKFNEEAKQEAQRIKNTKVIYRKSLEEQYSEKKKEKIASASEMTEMERCLNKDLLVEARAFFIKTM
ncbi:predicted protein [Chaetoceros tenuissimus]|uniref:Uncharacterized protein n=1 Tax=Chaetoceros tenuissimus TaxID=426638 RepID=A0AAD3CLK8_9STRA|nr:predicted protein [Chaetoceros tenuissimus]